MMGSKKFYVPPALLALALLGSGTALGQEFCTVSAPNSGIQVRAEGVAELVDDIIMSCFEGAVAARKETQVVVDLGNVKITNKIVSNDNEVADEIKLKMYNTETNYSNDEPVAKATGKLSSDSSVKFVFDSPKVEVDGKFRLKISGIRVNAADAGEGSAITASVSSTGASIFDDSAVVARPVQGLKSKRIGYVEDDTTLFNSAVEGLACSDSKKISSAKRDDDKDITIVDIEVLEGFVTAFKTTAGNEGIRIQLSFKDIPNGVDVNLRPQPNCSFEADGSGVKRTGKDEEEDPYVYTKKDGKVGDVEEYLELSLMNSLDDNNDFAVPGDDDDNYVQVNLSNGSGSAVYQITADGGAGNDKCHIPIAFVWTSDSVGLGTGTVSANFAPVSSIGSAHVSASIPRFVRTGSALDIINIEDCSTTLLFPFVSNQALHDTGIAISNTSADAFGTSPHNGTCTIHYHGKIGADGVAPSEQTSTSIEAGEQLIFMLSTGNEEQGISGTEGFQGYLMARCEFQFAHGLAFITNGYGGTPNYAQSYLALVVPVKHGDRGVSGGGHEMLAQ